MSDALLYLKPLTLSGLLSLCLVTSSLGEPLVLVGQSAIDATLVSANGKAGWTFRVDNEELEVSDKQLVRWATVPMSTKASEVLLTDGTRIVLAASWTGAPSWQLTDKFVSATTNLFGKLELPRDQVRAILLHAPEGRVPRTKFVDQLLAEANAWEGLRLTNGDRWDAKRFETQSQANGQRALRLILESDTQPIDLPEDQVAAIVFKSTPRAEERSTNLSIGTRDGSLLKVESVRDDGERLLVRLAGGVEIDGINVQEVTYLRSSVSPIEYLSDRDVADYHYLPYLDIAWPFRRDRNVLDGPLQAEGQTYAKGLGVHTAARLTYDLDVPTNGKRLQRFVASVVVDSAAGNRGSVIFRVYLNRNDVWQQAFASPIVRGGEAPLPITVELKDATQLALVTDFADRGDELDYANWLEARLE